MVLVKIERPGWSWCEHTWRNESYNDWGFPYSVARCTNCGRRLSSPTATPYDELENRAHDITPRE